MPTNSTESKAFGGSAKTKAKRWFTAEMEKLRSDVELMAKKFEQRRDYPELHEVVSNKAAPNTVTHQAIDQDGDTLLTVKGKDFASATTGATISRPKRAEVTITDTGATTPGKLRVLSDMPGDFANAFSVRIMTPAGGAAAAAFDEASKTLQITPATGGSTINAIKTAVEAAAVGDATKKHWFRVDATADADPATNKMQTALAAKKMSGGVGGKISVLAGGVYVNDEYFSVIAANAPGIAADGKSFTVVLKTGAGPPAGELNGKLTDKGYSAVNVYADDILIGTVTLLADATAV